MKGYILTRLLRSIISILLIMGIVFWLVYACIPRDNIFFEDSTYRKLGGKPDDKTEYVYTTWERLGYLDYVKINDYCLELYEAGSEEMKAGILPGSEESAAFREHYEGLGYTVEEFSISKQLYAYKDVPMITRLGKWFSNLVQIDTINSVQDPDNPDLERKIYFGRTPTGGLALCGSGTTHKYLLYTDSHFPFIHQNFITLNMGTSYPTFQGIEALTVMFQEQGEDVKRPVVFDTGLESESAINFGSLTYKAKPDRMDRKKFVDNYANYTTFKNQPSMVGTSFIMGFFAMLLSYLIGLPFGLAMAKHKDGVIDWIGMAYFIFTTSVPSLAYILLVRRLGVQWFGLPSVFTTFGPGDIRSWILPIISLAMPSVASLMLWTRRYMVDQMNSDYVKFARAKGLNQGEIYRKHIFKNASIPIIHGIPAALAGCITGAIMTEAIYAVGGMGKMLPNAIKQYNNIVVIALTFLYASISILAVLAGDIIITKVDPRIALSGKAGRS